MVRAISFCPRFPLLYLGCFGFCHLLGSHARFSVRAAYVVQADILKFILPIRGPALNLMGDLLYLGGLSHMVLSGSLVIYTDGFFGVRQIAATFPQIFRIISELSQRSSQRFRG